MRTFALIFALIGCIFAAAQGSFAKWQDYPSLALAESSESGAAHSAQSLTHSSKSLTPANSAKSRASSDSSKSRAPTSRSQSRAEATALSAKAHSKKRARLPQIAREAMAYHFGDHSEKFASTRELIEQFEVLPNFRQSRGLFITLSKNGKTRACWGSTTADWPDLVSATVHTTFGALQKEYRFPQIKRHEWKNLNVQVTVIEGLQPVDSWRSVNPLRDGMFVRNGGRAAIILPGEAVDAYYQFVLCKLKAGIPPKQRCQVYKVKCDVYH